MPRKTVPRLEEDEEVKPIVGISEKPAGSEEPSSSQEASSTALASNLNSRPKRVARKSVLYHNDDFEVNIPGVKIEEENEQEGTPEQSSDLTPVVRGSTKRRGTSNISNVSSTEGNVAKVMKKRKLPPSLEPEEEIETHSVVGGDEQEQADDMILMGGQMELQPEVGANEEYQMIDDPVCLQLGAETEIPHSLDDNEDDGPPRLRVPQEYDMVGDPEHLQDFDEDFIERGVPPQLEINMPLGKRRGRPRKMRETGDELDETVPATEKKEKQSRGAAAKAKAFRVPGDRVVSKSVADRVSQYHVKLFEDEIQMTELGDCYATVISGCLAYLLRKERIIDILTSVEEINMIREGGWMIDKPPRLPPLVTHKGCFAFYVDGSKMTSIKDISSDDLKPWSSSDAPSGEPVIKPNVRRHPVARMNNRLVPIKGDPRLAELHLTEYSAWLPRLLRLRKKIFYLSREGHIYGNVLILYDYTCPGEAPAVINLPHGNDYLRGLVSSEADEHAMAHPPAVGDADHPFEDEIIQGHRGGNYFRVRPSKLGWVHNKKLLLKYLINEPGILDDISGLNRRVPFLPPLIETAGVFVYFVPASFVANQIHHTGDGLSPWTVTQSSDSTSSPRVRSTRRALNQDEHGLFVQTRESWQQTGLCLVETLSVLARCPRLRKRVVYVQRNNSIIMGNVCYIYEYVREGPVPTLTRPLMGKPAIETGQPGWDHVGRKLKSNDDEQFIDVEEMEVVEEEIVGDMMEDIGSQSLQSNVDPMAMDPMQALQPVQQMQEPIHEDFPETTEDVLNNGWDPDFDDDPLLQQENPDPYFETGRMLESGHIYLTVRHKRVASTFDCVLEWIANTNVVEERGLLNYSKPGHPPIVRNSRCYAFFVAGTAIFPHDINRDDFSPWSHNGTPEQPTCYRTKVRKIGVICDDLGSQFQMKDVDYKTCPFHLVFLYSINPRDPRLRKKIYYMMETESRLVVSHALILYDYNVEGPLPRLHGGYLKRFSKKPNRRQVPNLHDVENDVSDVSETEKECPFALPPLEADDGTMYLTLTDMDFWNDRNRQLHFLVNKPSLVESLGCLNNRVPALPPATSGKGGYVFFVDGCEVDSRNLTCDGLVPWSENMNSNPQGGTTKRPKSTKHPLGLNREGQLRVWKTPPMNSRHDVEFQLHVYSATLPRCPRLKKKVTYVVKGGNQIGHSMIIYWFTESGEMPIPVNVGSLNVDVSVHRIPTAIRQETVRLLMSIPPTEVAKVILERHGLSISQKTLLYLRRKEMNSLIGESDMGHPLHYGDIKNEMMEHQFIEEQEWNNEGPSQHGEDILMARGDERVREDVGTSEEKMMHVVDEGSIQVAHTEEIQGQSQVAPAFPRSSNGRGITLGEQLTLMQNPDPTTAQLRLQNSFFPKSSVATSAGGVRGSQRTEAIWRIVKSSYGTTNDNETFDMLWKMMLDKNEQRLLHNVHQTFGIEIIAGVVDGEQMEEHGEMIQLEEDGMDNQMVHETVVGEHRDESEEGKVVGMHDEGKVYIGEEDQLQEHQHQKIDGVDMEQMEQVIVEEEVHDHLLEHALVVEEVIMEGGEQEIEQQQQHN